MQAEVRWLPTSLLKDIKYPVVNFVPKGNYGGFYTHGTNVLNIVEDKDDSLIQATIAHEFKHYVQWTNGTIDPRGSNWTKMYKEADSYEAAIKTYFTTQIDELEALLFEYKHAKSWLNDWWLNKLVKE